MLNLTSFIVKWLIKDVFEAQRLLSTYVFESTGQRKKSGSADPHRLHCLFIRRSIQG